MKNYVCRSCSKTQDDKTLCEQSRCAETNFLVLNSWLAKFLRIDERNESKCNKKRSIQNLSCTDCGLRFDAYPTYLTWFKADGVHGIPVCKYCGGKRTSVRDRQRNLYSTPLQEHLNLKKVDEFGLSLARIKENADLTQIMSEVPKIKRTKLTFNQRIDIFNRDGNRCLKCSNPSDLTIDHIVPLARGGSNDRSNLQTLCTYCNVIKGENIEDYRPRAGSYFLQPRRKLLSFEEIEQMFPNV